MKKNLILAVMIIITLQSVLGAHYIVGFVNNSYDTTSPNGREITLWNPLVGMSDNQTDIIGTTGNSGTDNIFMIDCELLGSPCQINDVLNVKIINTGDNYTIETLFVTVTGAGFSQTQNTRLNTPPTPTLESPVNKFNTSEDITFNCSWIDEDYNVDNITLWGNWSGGWTSDTTLSVSGGETYKTFTKSLPEGSYLWTCFAQDNLTTGKFASENRTLTVDKTNPVVSSILVNASSFCGTKTLRVNCTVTDALTEIDTTIIQSISPTLVKLNYTAAILTGNTYYRDIEVGEVGNWTFKCIANDSSGNEASLESSIVEGYYGGADLHLTKNLIFLNATPTQEFDSILVNVTLENKGCGVAVNFKMGLFEGEKDSGGTSHTNNTESISGLETKSHLFIWPANIGLTNLFVYADLDNTISEYNESDNEANITIYLQAWQDIYGNTTINRVLATQNLKNISMWINEENSPGNVFITDTECDINWYNLQAIGRDEANQLTSDDFTNIDTILSMTTFNDSVYQKFTNSGTPIDVENFTLFNTEVYNVPIINSTENSAFQTGILWDTSDDTSANDEYDTFDKEDLVFVTKINRETQGKYGIYDYEIKIPARLREYYTTDTADVYYYYELE